MDPSASAGRNLALPAVGDELFEFRLRHELGKDNKYSWTYRRGTRRHYIYGAKLVENVVQALAFVFIMEVARAVKRLTDGFYIPVHQVHDELIYIVDDACPEHSVQHVLDVCTDERVRVLFHEENRGVGGAVLTGYRQAIADSGEAPAYAGVSNQSPYLDSLMQQGVTRYGTNFISEKSPIGSGETGGLNGIKGAKVTIIQAPPLYHTTGEVAAMISTPGLERIARFLSFFITDAAKAPLKQINP